MVQAWQLVQCSEFPEEGNWTIKDNRSSVFNINHITTAVNTRTRTPFQDENIHVESFLPGGPSA